MSADKVIVLITGIIGIIFTYWFFLGKKEKAVEVSDSTVDSTGTLQVDIKVEGGYSPSSIILKKGKTTKINFLRTDPSSCLEEVILWDFKIKKFLPLHEKVTVEITPQKTGEFNFACGMNMFHGKIIVK